MYYCRGSLSPEPQICYFHLAYYVTIALKSVLHVLSQPIKSLIFGVVVTVAVVKS